MHSSIKSVCIPTLVMHLTVKKLLYKIPMFTHIRTCTYPNYFSPFSLTSGHAAVPSLLQQHVINCWFQPDECHLFTGMSAFARCYYYHNGRISNCHLKLWALEALHTAGLLQQTNPDRGHSCNQRHGLTWHRWPRYQKWTTCHHIIEEQCCRLQQARFLQRLPPIHCAAQSEITESY